MRKIAMAVGMLMISSSCVFAMPDRSEKVDAGFQIGGLLPDSGNLDAAAYYGGTVAYGVNDWFAVGLEGGYADSKTDFNIGGTAQQGNISRIPLFLDLIFRYTKFQDHNYVPYGTLGLGAVFTNISGTGTFQSANLKLDVDNSFAVKFGVGVDWFMNDKWALNLEASYVWVDSDVNVVRLSGDSIADSANMDYWTILGGVKYLFD